MKVLLLSLGLLQLVLGGPVRKDGPVPNTPENSMTNKTFFKLTNSAIISSFSYVQLQSLNQVITNKISRSLVVNSKEIWY